MTITARLGTADAQPGNISLSYSPIYASAISTIQLGQTASARMDCHTAFDKVIPLLGFSQDSQGTQALVHALLQVAANLSPREAKHTNPFHEALYRLEQCRINPHAMTILRQFFNAATERYDRS